MLIPVEVQPSSVGVPVRQWPDRARAWPGFAVGQSVCERGQVLIGTPPHCEDRPYPGYGGFYAIDN